MGLSFEMNDAWVVYRRNIDRSQQKNNLVNCLWVMEHTPTEPWFLNRGRNGDRTMRI